MEFALTSQQRLTQESVVRTLQDCCPPERIRRLLSAGEPYAEDVAEKLGALGVPAMLVSPDFDGLGLTLLDAALVSEALGRFAAPVPFLGSCICALALCEGGTTAQKERWLPRLASGSCIGGLGLSEAVAGSRDGAGLTYVQGALSGSALFVIDGLAAELFLVADSTQEIFLVEHPERSGLISIDGTRSLAELRLSGIVGDRLAGARLDRLRDAAWILLAADTLGAAEHMLAQAVEYAKQRQQFGRIIGSFQAVKHLCAEAAACLEPARALVWYAAHLFDARPQDASLAAAHAKAHLSEVGSTVARIATEVHGGIGITDALGLHYWFKRIGLNRQLLGGPDRVRTLAAEIQGLSGA